ncbi:MAG TPA: nuclear transport factor 2 family protein [Thermoanaerobaculia bacterium]|nr:nuclear transport factor 2 family protein [Thermoanaerobaculia bacterium]
MVRVITATFIAALLSTAALGQPAKSNEQQIRDRLNEFAATWNKHDPTNMAYFWSVDGDLINPSGRKAKGLTEIQRLFQDEQTGVMKNSTYAVTSASIRMLEPTLAFVDSDAEITGVANPDGSTATMKPHVTVLMRKTGGKWWVVTARAFTFFIPPPPPPPPAPK